MNNLQIIVKIKKYNEAIIYRNVPWYHCKEKLLFFFLLTVAETKITMKVKTIKNFKNECFFLSWNWIWFEWRDFERRLFYTKLLGRWVSHSWARVGLAKITNWVLLFLLYFIFARSIFFKIIPGPDLIFRIILLVFFRFFSDFKIQNDLFSEFFHFKLSNLHSILPKLQFILIFLPKCVRSQLFFQLRVRKSYIDVEFFFRTC